VPLLEIDNESNNSHGYGVIKLYLRMPACGH